MGRKHRIYGGIAAIVVISLLLGTGSIGYQHIPSASAQVNTRHQVSVLIENPPNGSQYPSDSAIPITFMVYGENAIANLEFWVDGVLYSTQTPQKSSDPKLIIQIWQWLPVFQGKHAITIRAIDVSGNIGTSNILNLVASQPVGFDLLYTSKKGDTWKDLQKLCTTSLKAIKRNNASLDTSQPVPAGATIRVPCDSPFESVSASTQSTAPSTDVGAPAGSSSTPNKLTIWIGQNILGTSKPPKAPALTAGLDNCTAQLMIQDNSKTETGFFVYRSNGSSFERIATLSSSSSPSFSYEDPVKQTGLFQYYVSAYNAAGETQSNIVPVQVADGSCGIPSTINSKLTFTNKILTIPPRLQLAYVYVSLDMGPWQRLPEGNQYFTPTAGNVDLQTYIAPLLQADPQARSADIEAWGWTNGDKIEDLGAMHLNIDNTTLQYCPTPGQHCTADTGMHFTDQAGVVDYSNTLASDAVLFSFQANDPGLTSVLVQISTQPFSNELQLDSPYLVDEYLVNASQDNGYIYGQFPIVFPALKKQGTSHPTVSYQNASTQNLNPDDTVFGSASGLSPSDELLFNLARRNGVGSSLLTGIFNPIFYFRVIPWNVNQPGGTASNTVAITYNPGTASTPPVRITQEPIYNLKITGFAPEQQIDPHLYGCVIVTHVDPVAWQDWAQGIKNAWQDNPLNGENARALVSVSTWYAEIQNSIDTGAAICPPLIIPQDPDESFWDKIGDFFSYIWNSITDIWDSLKDAIVNIVADLIHSMTGLCDSDDCKTALKAGLNIAITYFTGLPPDLPTTGELENTGLDYLVRMAVDQAGIACDQSCLNDISTGYQKIKDLIVQQDAQPACYNSSANQTYNKNTMCLPPGVSVEPVPGATYKPAAIGLVLTRNSNPVVPDNPFNYSVQMTVDVTHPAEDGQFKFFFSDFVTGDGNYHVAYWYLPTPQPAGGQPFQTVTLQLPGDAVSGSQIYLPVSLKNNPYTYAPFEGPQARDNPLADYAMYIPMYPNDLNTASEQFLTSTGATFTIHARLICTPRFDTGGNCDNYSQGQDTFQYATLQGVILP